MHHGDDNKDLDSIVERYEGRTEEEGEEEKADPGTKAEQEAKLRRALSGTKGAAIGGEVGKPGATGLFPGGKLTAGDQGQIGFKVGHTNDKKKVILDFGKPVSWLGFSPAEAFGISKALRKHAKKCRP